MSNSTGSDQDAQIEAAIAAEPPADLYQPQTTLTDGITGLGAVTDEDIAFFKTYGYLIIHDAFSADEVSAALAGIVDLTAGHVPGYDGVSYEAQAQGVLHTIPPEQRQDYVRRLWNFVEHEPRLRHMSHHPDLLAILTRIIGEEPLLFQNMGLLKPPRIGREKPWHQDFAYFNLPLDTQVAGVWIALDDATPENGCMHIIPGSHRDGPVVHYQRRDWQICDTDVRVGEVAAVPLSPGSCLIFDGLLHHGTPPSRSAKRRRAVQYHYKPARVPFLVDSSNRLAVFGEEGKDVTC